MLYLLTKKEMEELLFDVVFFVADQKNGHEALHTVVQNFADRLERFRVLRGEDVPSDED